MNGLGVAIAALFVPVLLWAEKKERRKLKLFSKSLASLGFVVFALELNAWSTTYGLSILTGLVFGLIGDVCLAIKGKSWFVAGLVSFLCGHAVYALAFLGLGQSTTMWGTIALLFCAVLVILFWAKPHAGAMSVPIAIYSVVIAAMIYTAVSATFSGATVLVAAGAIIFAISDLAVLRERFIRKQYVNKLVGLPLYYLAQLLIAASLAWVV